MMPKVLEAAADVTFAASAARNAWASSKRPILLEELGRRLEILRAELEPKGDKLFSAGVPRNLRGLQVLALACEDWMADGADAGPDSETWNVVAHAMGRVGKLIGDAAPKDPDARKGGGAGILTRSTSKTTCGEA